MDRRFTSLVGMMVLAAAVRFPGSPQRSLKQSDGDSEVANTPNVNPSIELRSVSIIPQSERGPWHATCQFFSATGQSNNTAGEGVSLTSPPDTEAFGLDKWCLPAGDRVELEFLFATVPDPLVTHLSLYFDRSVESIQWAAQDAQYYFDRYWLPWNFAPTKNRDFDPEKSRRERILREIRERQPGLLLFRKAEEQGTSLASFNSQIPKVTKLLLVFLVGESPTAGVNKIQFENAVRYMQELEPSSSSKEIRVLGPSFSGSIYSLKRVLTSRPGGAHVISGSATNRRALDSLNDVGIHHDEVIHDDQVALQQLLPFLHSLGYERRDVALLLEDETAYGKLADPDPYGGSVLRIRFPREVSRLRNAYPEDSESTEPASARKTQTLQNTNLPLSLKDNRSNEDDVPPFSLGQMPLSQEAVLLNIATTLRREKIRVAGIVATDIFDTLFLSRFLRLSLPDIRLFILDSDLLMARATDTMPLEGTLAVTTYPLISRNQHWTGPDNRSSADGYFRRILFPSRYAQAEYNACLALLLPNQNTPLLEYSDPGGHRSAPPLWLTVLGHDGYWPITLLSKAKGNTDAGLLSWQHPKGVNPSSEPPSGSFLLLSGLFFCIASIHVMGIFHSFLSLRKEILSIRGKRALQLSRRWLKWWLEYFSFDSVDRVPRQKALFLLIATLVLATIAVLLFLPFFTLLFHSSSQPASGLHSLTQLGKSEWQPAWAFVLFFLFSFFVTISLVVLALWLQTIVPLFSSDRHLARLAWTVFLLAAFGWGFLVLRGAPEGTLFAYRCMDLFSFVSPSVPFLALLIAFYVWAWVQLRRLRFWETRRPLLPADGFDDKFKCGFARIQLQLRTALLGLSFHPSAFILSLPVILAACLLLRPWYHFRSFEAPLAGRFPLFDWMYLVVFVFLYACLLLSWANFIYVWWLTRDLLRRLERLPLRVAFDRLPKKLYSWAPIWQIGGTRRTYVLMTRSRECLDKLSRYTPRKGLLHLYRHRLRLSRALDFMLNDEAVGARERSRVMKCVRKALCAASEYLLRDLLFNHWGEGNSDSLQEEEQKQLRKTSDKEFEYEKSYIIAEEFVAIRFVSFVRYISLQLRNQLSFVIIGFILSLISVRSYPFQSHRGIGWTLTAIFAIMSTGIVIVFAQMDKDAILSRISDTEPGKLDKDFYLRIAAYGALPVVTVLASQFPSVSHFLFSWVQPSLEALR